MSRHHLLAAGLGLCIGCGGGDGAAGPSSPLTVMTRNLYLGSELTSIILAGNVSDIPLKAAEIWKSVQASDIPGRAKLIAAEIATATPDLVGLQEVEVFRTQTPSDFSYATPENNAATVVYDFLDDIMKELEARGAHYKVAVLSELSDNEMPCQPADSKKDVLFDLRMTDRDAILIRDDLAFTNPKMAIYDKFINIKIAGDNGIPIKIYRGYETIDVTSGNADFTFANSHLEVGGPAAPFQEAQGYELAQTLGHQAGNIILVGDFNSPADGSDTKSYKFLTERFVDVWPKVHPDDPGFTCCAKIAAASFHSDQRLDLALMRGSVRADAAAVVGNDAAVRTPAGVVASDHAGVTARLLVADR